MNVDGHRLQLRTNTAQKHAYQALLMLAEQGSTNTVRYETTAHHTSLRRPSLRWRSLARRWDPSAPLRSTMRTVVRTGVDASSSLPLAHNQWPCAIITVQ